jgi:hypothetical protein
LAHGEGAHEIVTEGVNMNKAHCVPVWKYHNETPLYN